VVDRTDLGERPRATSKACIHSQHVDDLGLVVVSPVAVASPTPTSSWLAPRGAQRRQYPFHRGWSREKRYGQLA